ncbi:glucoside xylosyltransferase 2-like [Hyalella azteca]|uniref:Glucoside xylosyltransferase 2-like n=1 Tax=Hyalella azteca TaxID=294128 RepID=A0A979FHW0_HYAAZ|nr:glucoside xylosyltransferase 2-like [Hyalella azteca]
MCDTEKLFLPWALPEFDSVVYLDTDHVFMRPPEHLTQLFKNFDDKQAIGVAPVDGYYLQFTIEIPYYGEQGLSAALLLSNLTRWRNLPFPWMLMVKRVTEHFKDKIVVGDQDIFNIIFSEFPEYIYDLSCDWASITEQCLTTNWRCSSIEQTGFSLVHGARSRFFRRQLWSTQPIDRLLIPMQEIFLAWERHVITDPVSVLLQNLTKTLHTREDELRQMRGSEETHQFCVYGFEKLLKQLTNFVESQKQ